MSGSRKSIFTAIAANVGIAAAKFTGFAFTGSAAMLSEAVHSLVDCGNGGLLLLGLRQAAKPADHTHPFGHGRELYFWSLIVAVLIFVLGGGISLAEGVSHVRHPSPPANPTWSYVILALAAVFEGYALTVALKEFKAAHPGPVIAEIRRSKDPSGFTTLFEDAAALLGLVFALAGTWLSHSMGWLWADGGASILIGLLLLVVAVLLIVECKSLLIGEGGDPEMLQALSAIVHADPDVLQAGFPYTQFFGPHTILLTMNVTFRGDLDGQRLNAAVLRLEAAIRSRYPDIRHIYLEIGAAAEALPADEA